jgi:hypothetical protein
MPVIKARTRGKHFVRHITRLERENQETLYAYATFLSEPSDYVLNQVIDTLLARDKEFQAWRDQHPGPHAPRPVPRKSRGRTRAAPATDPARAHNPQTSLPVTHVS